MSGCGIIPANSSERVLPYNGTIFTARLPSSHGGKNADLILQPYEGVFKGYNGHTSLFNIQLLGDDSVDLLHPGDLCRLMVYDDGLKTAHSLSQRNWFNALLLRPVYHAEPMVNRFSPAVRRDMVLESNVQCVMEPQDSRAVIGAALGEDTIFLQELESKTFRNDFHWLTQKPRTILQGLLASLSSNIM